MIAESPRADRQPHRAEDAARADRRLDRPLPRRRSRSAMSSGSAHRSERRASNRGFAAPARTARARDRPSASMRSRSPRSSPTCARAATRRCCDYTARFDRLTLDAGRLRICAPTRSTPRSPAIPAALAAALDLAAARIEAFHRAQMPRRPATRRCGGPDARACAGRRSTRSGSMCRAARRPIPPRC